MSHQIKASDRVEDTQTGQPASRTTEAAEPESAAGKLFDLRVLIGGLFSFYGIVLIVAGITASSAELHKAANININLWMGLGMLILGVLFLVWWRVKPLEAKAKPAPEDMQPQLPRLEKETRPIQQS